MSEIQLGKESILHLFLSSLDPAQFSILLLLAFARKERCFILPAALKMVCFPSKEPTKWPESWYDLATVQKVQAVNKNK